MLQNKRSGELSAARPHESTTAVCDGRRFSAFFLRVFTSNFMLRSHTLINSHASLCLRRLFVDPLLARGGDSPVLWATRTRQTEALRKMLELGLDATAVGANGATPMHVCDDDDVAVLLADFGGRLDAKDTAGIDAGTALKNNIRMRMLPWVREEAEKERLEQEAARAAAAKEQEEAAAAPGTGEDVSEGHEAEGKAQHGGDEPSDGSVPTTEGEPTDEAEAAKTPAKPRVLTDDEKALASDVEKQIAETIKRVSQAAVVRATSRLYHPCYMCLVTLSRILLHVVH
eukprot:6195461-Pleurochrysis_carterae.AAC.9